MSIIRNRLNFSADFVQVPNAWMRDARLSHRARGILAEVMTHSDGWEITVQHLTRNGTEGRDAVRAAIRELVEHEYLVRVFDRDESGKATGSHYELQIPPNDGFPGGRDSSKGVADFQAVGFPVPRKSATKNTNPKNTNTQEHQEPAAGAAGGQDSLFLDEGQTVTVEVVETPEPWDVIGKRAYDATKGALPYMGMRAIAKWAVDKAGYTPQATEDAMAALYENGQAVTRQSVAQVLDGVRTPGRSANRSMDRVAGNLSLAERIARGQA